MELVGYEDEIAGNFVGNKRSRWLKSDEIHFRG